MLEKSFNIKSNLYPSTDKSTIKPYPDVPHLQVF